MNTRATLFKGLARSLACVAIIAMATATLADENSSVVAVNVLVVPDEPMRQHALQLNERLRQDQPRSFAFDSSRIPHITILQRFVAAKDLPQVYDSVGRVLAKHPLTGKSLATTGVERSRWGNGYVMSIKVENNPELERLQAALIEALRQYSMPSGGRDAFIRSPGPEEIDAETIEYVKTFEQQQAGERFKPHITAGLADATTTEQLSPQLLAPMTFKIEAIAIYQLGNVGTARKQLWRSPNP